MRINSPAGTIALGIIGVILAFPAVVSVFMDTLTRVTAM